MEENRSPEEQFLLDMKELLEQAKRQGGKVTEEEVRDAFETPLNEQQYEVVRNYLDDNHVGIGRAVDIERLLTPEEEKYLREYGRELASLEQPDPDVLDAVKLNAMAGETEAQNELATYMLPKVVDIAKLYAGQGVYIQDLIGTGNMALMAGVKLLAPLSGPEEVEGDLAQRVMNAMEELINEDMGSAAIGEDALEKVNRVAEAAHELAQELGRKVTVMELVGEGEFTEDEVMDAIRFCDNKIPDIDYRQPLLVLPRSVWQSCQRDRLGSSCHSDYPFLRRDACVHLLFASDDVRRILVQ